MQGSTGGIVSLQVDNAVIPLTLGSCEAPKWKLQVRVGDFALGRTGKLYTSVSEGVRPPWTKQCYGHFW